MLACVTNPMFTLQKFCFFFEKYGLLFIALLCFQLLSPDLSIKSDMMHRDLEAFNDGIGGSNKFKQIFWLSAFAIFSFCLFARGVRFIERESHRLIVYWGALLIVCCLSLIWSLYPSYTVKRLVFQVLLVFSLTASVFFSIKHSTFSINIRYLIFAAILMGLICLLLQGFNSSGFAGWAKTKNTFGGYILALMMLVYLKSNFESFIDRDAKKENLIFLFILFSFLLLSLSKTSIALSLLFLFFVFFGRVWNKLFFLTIFIVTVSLKVIVPGLANLYGVDWNIAMHMDDETLTGRGYIWKLLYGDLYHSERVLLGYGYGAYYGVGETPEYLEDPYSFVQYLNSAHNSYIELLLQFGFIFTTIILLVLGRMVSVVDSTCCYVCATIIGLHGISESGLLKDAHVMWVVTVVSLAFGSYLNSKNFKHNELNDPY